MRPWKIEDLEADLGAGCPQIRQLPAEQRDGLRRRVARLLGGDDDADDNWIIVRINERAPTVLDVFAKDPDFSITAAMEKAGIPPPSEVCLAFTIDEAFDEVDVLPLSILESHFKDIWYPGADDLLITEPDPKWLLMVFHCGIVASWPEPQNLEQEKSPQ
jgi:hypothetical protein